MVLVSDPLSILEEVVQGLDLSNAERGLVLPLVVLAL
jgi:hypothetical protein